MCCGRPMPEHPIGEEIRELVEKIAVGTDDTADTA